MPLGGGPVHLFGSFFNTSYAGVKFTSNEERSLCRRCTYSGQSEGNVTIASLDAATISAMVRRHLFHACATVELLCYRYVISHCVEIQFAAVMKPV